MFGGKDLQTEMWQPAVKIQTSLEQFFIVL